MTVVGDITTTPSDLLRIADLTAAQLHALLDLADEMRGGPAWWAHAPSRRAVAFVFDEQTTCTRTSFEEAARRLGMAPIALRPGELRLRRGELAETARTLSGYASAIVIRTAEQATLRELADAASVPVVNGLTDDHHPSQALADLLTLRRHFGYLEGLRIGYVGARSNVAHSLMEAGALAGMHVSVATPPGQEPDPALTREAYVQAGAHGGSVRLFHDPHNAVVDADAVYVADRPDGALLGAAAPHAVLMRRDAGTGDGARSIAGEQAANRLPTAQALLHTLVAGLG